MSDTHVEEPEWLRLENARLKVEIEDSDAALDKYWKENKRLSSEGRNLQSRLDLAIRALEYYAPGHIDGGSLAKSILETETEQQRRADLVLTTLNSDPDRQKEPEQ